jgi:NitT/TauT family transport system permease protein
VNVADVGRGLAGTGAAVVGYELGRVAGLLPSSLPGSTAVGRAAVELVRSGEFWSAAWTTARGAALGLVLATAAGTVLGLLLATSRWARRLLSLPIDLVRTVPAVALAPILVQAVGRGVPSRAIAVAYATTWPILFNTIAGVRHVDPVAVDTARTFGFGRVARAVRIAVPSALPFIVTGIRVAIGIAVIVEVAVEIFVPDSTDAGIGGLIALSAINGADDAARSRIYAAAVLAGVLSLALDAVARRAERRWSW